MTRETDNPPNESAGDLVLQEIWRAKDELSAAYNHDIDELFAQLREREKMSGHPVVNLTKHKNGGQ